MSPEQRQKLIDAGYSASKIAAYERAKGLSTMPEEKSQSSSALKTTAGVLDTVVGGGKIGEAIGTQIARYSPSGRKLAAQEAAGIAPEGSVAETFKNPSALQLGGDAVRTAVTFAPVGKIASLATKGLTKLGLTRGVQTAGNIVAGGATGATADLAVTAAEGETPRLGMGTVLGAGIPAASPVLKALARTSAKFAGKGAAEIQGALTGTSAETIEQAFNAARTGGDDLDQFTSALRGKTTPEALVNTVRENIDTISSQRQTLFKNTLRELGDTTVSTQPAKAAFTKQITDAGITIDENGLLNFSNSKLRTVPNAQTKLQQAWAEVQSMPETMSLADLDTTRQAVKGIKSIGGDEPSANLANKLIEDGVRSVRVAGEQVDGYGTMLDNFAESSEFLDELERGLSAGDSATIDQAYRRMATALKTNNEQRAALVRELDEATDGAILSTIAGQQLSEALPRGIFRQIAAGIAGAGIATGGISAQLLPALVFASPRATGEFVRALGIGTAKAEQVIDAVAKARGVLIKAGAIGGAVQNGSDLE